MFAKANFNKLWKMRWGHNQESTRKLKLKTAVSHVKYKDNSTPWWYICMNVCIGELWAKYSRYSDWLRAGRSGDWILVEARFSAPVQTGPGAHPVSCTGYFPGVKSGQGVMLSPYPLLVPLVMKELELYLYSPCGPYGLYRASVPVQGCTLPFMGE